VLKAQYLDLMLGMSIDLEDGSKDPKHYACIHLCVRGVVSLEVREHNTPLRKKMVEGARWSSPHLTCPHLQGISACSEHKYDSSAWTCAWPFEAGKEKGFSWLITGPLGKSHICRHFVGKRIHHLLCQQQPLLLIQVPLQAVMGVTSIKIVLAGSVQ
jgi:hypothetical protein